LASKEYLCPTVHKILSQFLTGRKLRTRKADNKRNLLGN
jgi:hypothetical protein